MLKSLPLGRAMLALVAVLCMLPAQGAQDYIYYAGDWTGWPSPTLTNQNCYEPFRIFATSPGVYDGIIEAPELNRDRLYHWFRFYGELAPEDVVSPWPYHTIFSSRFISGASEDDMIIQSVSGIYIDDVAYFPYNTATMDGGGGCWSFRNGGPYNKLRFHVDLNEKKMCVITEKAVIPVLNSDVVPSVEEAAAIPNICEGYYTKWIPAGELKFRLYDYMNQRWMGYAGGDITLKTGTFRLNNYDLAEDGGYFVYPNWPGGLLRISEGRIDCITGPQAFVPTSDIYLVGDFSGWSFYGENIFTRESEGVYTIDIPQGATMVKFAHGPSWAENWGGDSQNDALVPSGDNIQLDGNINYSCVVDFNKMGYAVWPTGTPRPTIEDYTLIPEVKDFVFIDYPGSAITPDKENLYYLSLTDLSFYDSGSSWYNTITVPAPGKFRLIAGFDAQGKPLYLCPGTEDLKITQTDREGNFHSPVTLCGDEGGYWIAEAGTRIELSLNKDLAGSSALTMRLPNGTPTKPALYDFIYLVGNITGWQEPAESNEDFYKNWKLEKTTNSNNYSVGQYYGHFTIPKEYAEDVMFRFYTDLEGWGDGGNSWGAQWIDDLVTVDYVPGSYYHLEPGKGAYYFTNMPAGEVYILVTLNGDDSYMQVSNEPIPGVEIAEPDTAEKIYIVTRRESDNGYADYQEMTRVADGVYTIEPYWDEYDLYLFTDFTGFATNTPEWAASCALVPVENLGTSLGVTEYRIERRDGINTESFTPIHYKGLGRQSGVDYRSVGATKITVDLNRNIVYLDSNDYAYMVGSNTNGEVPTLETRNRFADQAVNVRYASVLNIPAGPLDVRFMTLSMGYLPAYEPTEVDLSSGIYWSPENNWYGDNIYGKNLVDNNWQGGDLYVCSNAVARLDAFKDIRVDGFDEPVIMQPTAEAGCYQAEIEIPEGFEGSYLPQISLGRYGERRLTLGSLGTVRDWYNDAETFTFEGSEFDAPLYGQGLPYVLNQLPAGKLTLTLDMNNMNLHGALSAPARKAFRIYANTETTEQPEENIFETAQPGVSAGDIMLPETEEDLELNFGSQDGKTVIVPAEGEENITFDENGYWSGAVRTVSATPMSRDAVAVEAGKWVIPAEYVGQMYFKLDEGAGRLELIAAKAIDKYYLRVAQDDGYFLGINYLYTEGANVMTADADGILRGAAYVPADGAISIIRGFRENRNVHPIYISERDVNLTLGEEKVVTVAEGNENGAINIHSDNGGEVRVAYNPTEMSLTLIRAKESGVETLDADAITRIEPMTGGFRVLAAEQTVVYVYNLQGMQVGAYKVSAGVTEVPFPAGLYIVNGTKLIVR